jgi:hypothetical protein
MNTTRCMRGLALGLTMGLATVGNPRLASALDGVPTPGPSTATGTLTRVGEYWAGVSSFAQARVHLNGTCDGHPVGQNFYIIITSGPLTGSTAETNSVSMKNAYSTLLTALLSGKTVEVQGLPSCHPSTVEGDVKLNLVVGNINILQ